MTGQQVVLKKDVPEEDHWWEVASDSSDATKVAAIVAAAIRDHVLPAIQAHLAGEA